MNNLELLRKRLDYLGGALQQDRMIKDKQKTLQSSLMYSYQGATVKKLSKQVLSQEENIIPWEELEHRALINPNKLKPDYDDKIISIQNEAGYKPGDIFEWVGTNTYWLIYLQQKTEKAYFRGDIRRCSFEIKWLNEQGKELKTYAAIRGPVETRIENVSIHKTIIDTPNHSLHILMPKNKDTLQKFKRYSKFYLQKDINKTCWRVEATDSISMEGILELTACEYYANKDEDNIEEGLTDIYIKKEDPNLGDNFIQGKVFIKPHIKTLYSVTELIPEASWKIDEKYPIKIINIDDQSIELEWTANYSGNFKLSYGDKEKTIVVESLF